MKCRVTGKDLYENKEQAKTAMARVRAQTRKRKPQRVYRCEFCQGFHLTSQTRRK